MIDDCSSSEKESQELSEEINVDFASCIGSLIYLSMTHTDIIYAVNKLAKFTRKPGKVHFAGLLHLLRYLRDNSSYGVRFYSNLSEPLSIKCCSARTLRKNTPFLASQTPLGTMTQIMEGVLGVSSSLIWEGSFITV
jgi:hypothetical protein